MITRCPACDTHFRVRAEQLAARAGQVRCGKCNRVFDALEHLIEEIVPARMSGSVPASDALRVETVVAERVPEPVAAEAQATGGQTQPPAEAETALAESRTAEAGTRQATGPEPALPERAIFDADAVASARGFDFGPRVKAESDGRRRRWLWPAGALLLLLILLAQAAYQYRGAIVLLFPEVKPYAAALCANLGCDLPLPRRIELISIEASDLQADTTNPSVMVLSATLKNRAVFSQQHPSIELTLTDAQDQPVERRALAPQDYLGRNGNAAFGANSEIAIKVYIEGSQVKATGYRLYLFYP